MSQLEIIFNKNEPLLTIGIKHTCEEDVFTIINESIPISTLSNYGADHAKILQRYVITWNQSHFEDQHIKYNWTNQALKIVMDQEIILFSDLIKTAVYRDYFQELIQIMNGVYLQDHPREILMTCETPEVSALYPWNNDGELHSGDDSGINLRFVEDVTIPAHSFGFELNFLVKVQPDDSRGFWITPRSSIGKTPIRLCNSLGLIDSHYRGCLRAKVDNLSNQDYHAKKGESLLQMALADLTNNWTIRHAVLLNQTDRGSGAFGSTGK